MKSDEDTPAASGSLILEHEDVGVEALLGPSVALAGPPIYCRPVGLLADGIWTSVPPLPTARIDQSEGSPFHRFVSLSGLGWGFVLAAVCWELFALEFSHYAGWGWDKGAFFFAWGLGILVCGFCLRTSRKQPADSSLFLGVNVLVLSVLSIVVATR